MSNHCFFYRVLREIDYFVRDMFIVSSAWCSEQHSTQLECYFEYDFRSLSCFVESCIVFPVCPQASIYDDNTGLYGSGHSSKAVSLLVCLLNSVSVMSVNTMA